jgi:hypothetical protein
MSTPVIPGDLNLLLLRDGAALIEDGAGDLFGVHLFAGLA